MPTIVDFTTVSTAGLETSPVAEALAGLRANEARYFKTKYGHDFSVSPASEAPETVDRVTRILKEERDLAIASRPLEATTFVVDGIRWDYLFYESGLVDQRPVHARRRGQARGRLQALRRHGGPGRARDALQVRAPEVQARGHHPRHVLRHQGRVLTAPALAPPDQVADRPRSDP